MNEVTANCKMWDSETNTKSIMSIFRTAALFSASCAVCLVFLFKEEKRLCVALKRNFGDANPLQGKGEEKSLTYRCRNH